MKKPKLEIGNWKLVRWATALCTRIPSFEFRFSDLVARLPWRLVLGAGCLLFLAIWLHEHDARLRRDLELQQHKQQTSAQVADLRTRAEAALREANQKNARVIADLEARRRQLEREGEALRQRLLLLHEEESQRVSEVATLPASELAERLKSRVPGFGVRPAAQRLGPTGRDSGEKGQVSGVGGQVSEKRVPDDQSQSPRKKSETPDTSHLAPDPLQSPNPQSPAPSPEFVLTEQGARRIETAFVELDSCREQSALKDRGLENCQEQAAVSQAVVGEMHKSLNDLNQAIRWKDEILTRVEAQQRAELKAARGSQWGRFVRAVEYVALGVAIGVVAR
jgi:hypothetical protein